MSNITDLVGRGENALPLSQRIKDLESSKRLIENTLNLISDCEIKGAYVKAVAEMVIFWEGLKREISDELKRLQPEVKE